MMEIYIVLYIVLSIVVVALMFFLFTLFDD